MFRALAGEVVEWLVVVLEVRDLGDTAGVFVLVERGLPGTGVPGPVDVLFAQFVANVFMALRHQHAGQVGFGVVRAFWVTNPGRPVGRGHGVDRVPVRCDSAGAKLRGAGHGALGRFIQWLEARAFRVVAFQRGDLALGHRVGGVRVNRHGGTDQVLVVEERAAKSALEEVVTQYELTGNIPQAQGILRLRVVAHGQTTGVAPGHKLVVFAVVDLHLVLIKHVPQVTGHQAQRQVFLIRAFKGEWCVGQVFLELHALRVRDTVNRLRAYLQDAAPGRWQGVEQAAIAVALLIVRRLERRQGFFDAGEVGEQVVETAVLGVNHHDGFHLLVEFFVQLGRGQRFSCDRGVMRGVCVHIQGRRTDTERGCTGEEATAAGIGRELGVLVFFVAHYGVLLTVTKHFRRQRNKGL